MLSSFSRALRVSSLVLASGAALVLSACGGGNDEPTPLAISFQKSGKFDIPGSIEGGLVEVTLTNDSKSPASAQLVRIDSGHTKQQALKYISGDVKKIPDWIHGEGGPGGTDPGKTATATVNLPAGQYFVSNDENQEGPPQTADFKVTEGSDGDLPETDASISVKDKGEDEYEFVADGLTAGDTEITFDNKSKNEELHHVQAFPVEGNASVEQIKKFLTTEKGKPPIDFEGVSGTSVTDGGTAEVTTLRLKKGKYALICFLTDRDGGKEHYKEGLLKEVEVK